LYTIVILVKKRTPQLLRGLGLELVNVAVSVKLFDKV